jgi:large subunit ribosomal protein L5
MATFKSVKTLSEESFKVLKDQFGYKNIMQAPRLTKVVVSVGTGSFKDKKKQELVADRLAKITGQKPVIRKAKQAIASYKTRIGDPIGYQVTIRGARMIGFLDKLLHVSLPRTKDFRGINASGVDNIGNMTIGLKEHVVFPEVVDEELKDVFGMAITVVTTAKTKAEAKAFFDHLGFPFKKEVKK